ncbi:B-cell receptor CD22-like isoform X2 [Platichthys flesus]|uniref:B-cell receptor CD22-like isoform X2 n=1 Tax=Platichthys flesus TaxID=8260 RepID=UPI002DB6E490|nr:B-cell receptor CD22-like isoform X2 [Platichthys flesus]XP_062244231.1 B-cell receptor CD22-like isoform X2 [Platichthys flesus]XP_062244232.1 B-cell receptor CD22-like isoform X2 [Platichthys flesus]
MGLREAASCFVIFLLSVSVVQGVDPWGVRYTPTQICAVKGSKVQIRCSYWHPSRIDDHDVAVEKTFWFTKVQDGEPVDLRSASEYTGRVKYDCGNKACTLTITDLRERDSDLYQFRFTTNQPTGRFTGSTGVTLSVTGVMAHIPKSSGCWWSDCSKSRVVCQTSCFPTPSSSYIWYKNGQKTWEQTFYSAYFESRDSISCAVRGHEDFPSAPVCVHGNSCNRVNYMDRNICAFKGSSVDISCSYNSHSDPITSKSWFVAEREDVQLHRPQAVDLLKDPEFTHRVQVLDSWRGRSTLRIKNLRLSDSAQYRFTFKSQRFEWERSFPGTTLTVTDVQVICSPIGPTLTCHSSCLLSGRPSFVWYKNGTAVHGETSPTFRGFLHPENSYSCAYEHHHSSPVYAPKVPLVQLSQPGDILKDSSVSLTCSSDANPPSAYTWYKENQALLNRAAQLVFRSIRSSDSGEYYCTAENELGKTVSKRVLINVKYALSVSPSGEIMEGSSVTLTCSSDANPAANYTWYKENRALLQGPEGVYRLSSISSGDSGVYSCKSENQYGRINSTSLHLDVQYAPQSSSVSVSPSGEIMEGSSVTLTCSSDANPAANYTWYKENRTLLQGPEGVYRLSSISSGDSGVYSCKSENQYGRINSTSLHLDVQYAPKPPSVSVSPTGDIMEGSSVTLTCSSDANPAANYTWYKEDEDSPTASGQIFTITDITAEHGGKYQCEAQNTHGRSKATLHLTVGAGKSVIIMNTIRLTLVVVLVPVLVWTLWTRMKKTLSLKSEVNEAVEMIESHNCPEYENVAAAAQTEDTEEQEDLV